MNVNEVSTILKDHGLKVEITEIDPDITTCAVIGQNLVISQSLEEGSEVEAGDTITLTVLKSCYFPRLVFEKQLMKQQNGLIIIV